MPSALAASQIDGYFVGEPFAGKALQTGAGKRFLDVESIWPNFICNLLIVRRELIESHPERVNKLVQTAVESGMWARDHVDEAIDIVSGYWGQDLQAVRYAFFNPPDRFRFDLYTPRADELNEIAREMRGEGFITGEIDGSILDDSFARSATADLTGSPKGFFSKLEHGAGSRAQAARQ
jgi:NitT/TauT family transport system substrate-binding protein